MGKEEGVLRSGNAGVNGALGGLTAHCENTRGALARTWWLVEESAAGRSHR